MQNNLNNSILIATQNLGKVTEMRRLLQPITQDLGVEIVGLEAFPDIQAPEESGATFAENAVIKARYYSDAFRMIALADDSGLAVDALDGAPGVRSARYGGPGLDDAGRTRLLLDNMAHIPDADRTARFVCAVCLAGNDPELLTAEGFVEGHITREPRGDYGFGYDPVFVPLGETRTVGEMLPEEKDGISHRGRAVRGLVPDLYEALRPSR